MEFILEELQCLCFAICQPVQMVFV